ncbi:MAG: 3-phosphoshikimate 1-carboxyvinyltransferase [Candidatus Omnitrophica bacterium]|nr:3-phosphoshikimate 1-carboxyvinyltransferase [Candidatus Omnitrophota bacterium]MBU1932489.1 3-phosphoshikimate 1-carboxyvinyltransferase [Candidatus Omnitrophota bacterium]
MKVVRIVVPPDKSISQRAIMFASISEGITRVKNLLLGNDCLRAIEAFRGMGVRIDIAAASYAAATDVVVYGAGMRGLKKPARPLFLGNSGTVMRILPGILAGQDFEVVLKGDASLSKRPMARIIEPLRKMGVDIRSSKEFCPPLKIHGGKPKAIKYRTKIASAQVKSCILLAGLYADGMTSVTEPVKSRDHTERMLKYFGCRLPSTEFIPSEVEGLGTGKALGSRVSVSGPVKLKSPGVIEIPGDISSAAFFIAAGCILPGMKVIVKKVGLNPTRTGVIDILKKMGADIKAQSFPRRSLSRAKSRGSGQARLKAQSGEPYGDIIVKSGGLKGVTISAKEVVRAIDEIPIIMVAACFAKGRTVIKGIKELRVKETDRVRSMVTNLRKMGADVNVAAASHAAGLAAQAPYEISNTLAKSLEFRTGQGSAATEAIVIKGGKSLHGAVVSSFGDHRTAMSMLIAGLAVKGVKVKGLECINKSFPKFKKALLSLT